MTATKNNLPHLPFARPDVLDIAPLLRTLRASAPITPVRTPAGDVAWLITRYTKVRALFADSRLGRSHPDPQLPDQTPEELHLRDDLLTGGCTALPVTW